LKDQLNNPEPGISVTFTVISGPNAGVTGTGISDASGQVSLTYTGNGQPGSDLIQACFVNSLQQTICSQNAKKDWVQPLPTCDIDQDGDVDRNDVNLIFAVRGQKVPPADPNRDIDGDGVITVNDARACVLKCTRPNCAP
jgi:hypothetical protein